MLAENAGLNPVQIISDLRARHSRGKTYDGINFRKVCDIFTPLELFEFFIAFEWI